MKVLFHFQCIIWMISEFSVKPKFYIFTVNSTSCIEIKDLSWNFGHKFGHKFLDFKWEIHTSSPSFLKLPVLLLYIYRVAEKTVAEK